MYLRKLAVENAGPITDLRLELPFADGKPQPVVIVGPNGSGKSTLLSFIVNALIGFKQQAFEQAEVEQQRVYRVRSGMFIRSGTHWYHAKAEFDEGLSLDEWVLDRPRKAFEAEVSPLPSEDGWKQIPEGDVDRFELTPQPQHILNRALSKPIQKLFAENVVLFFPSDRFELPDWLNERSLAPELRFPEPVQFQGHTARRIFSRALLKPTLEWIKAVTLDAQLADFQPVSIQLGPVAGLGTTIAFVQQAGRDTRILNLVSKVLARVLDADTDSVGLSFSNRNMGTVAVVFTRAGQQRVIPNLLGLSAGQAALFCLFSNIVRDLDLAGARFEDTTDVRGIVVLDEADLHLHVDLQHQVFPRLMQLFPRVQFIVTAHSPLFVMGMERAYGNAMRVIEMPGGNAIDAEAFGEFGRAFDAFSKTRTFDQRVLNEIRASSKPTVVVEGKSDVLHLETAWQKLHPGMPAPWAVVRCGAYSPDFGKGGAIMLRTLLQTYCWNPVVPALGLFDRDQEGVDQTTSLRKDWSDSSADHSYTKHPTQPVHALLLPVPPGREKFVSTKPRACHLSIEHYYSDELLQRFHVADDPVVADSVVFGITSDSKKKVRFAEAAATFDVAEFSHFDLIFTRLAEVLGLSLDSAAELASATGLLASGPASFPIEAAVGAVAPLTVSSLDVEKPLNTPENLDVAETTIKKTDTTGEVGNTGTE
ncbi:MAG: AAA family ATPase [Gemmataceae bacterium]